MKIVVLHDAHALTGRPDERDGIVQVKIVADTLHALGHDVRAVALDLDLSAVAAELRLLAPDLVFNLVEAVEGKGRLIHLAPMLLDHLGLPYTGVGSEPMLLSSHKVWTKRWLQRANLPTPPWVEVNGTVGGHPHFPATFVVKSIWEDASVGLDENSLVRAATPDELRAPILERLVQLGGEGFAEVFVEGREFNLSILEGPTGPQVLPPAEMLFVDFPAQKPRLVGYRAKWDESSFEYHHTRRSFEFSNGDGPLLAELEHLSWLCWQLFDLRGYARVDFRVDVYGHPLILELNPNPCLSPDAGFVAAAERAGLHFPQVVQQLVDNALRRAQTGRLV